MEPTTIMLEPAGFSFAAKVPWQLELTETEVTLKKPEGELVFTMPRAAAIGRLMVYDSGSKVMLVGDQGEKIYFKGDRGQGAAALRAYQDFALAQDPEAVRALKRQGVGLLGLGTVLGVLCWGFILTMLLVEPFRSMKTIPPALGWIFYCSWMPALASPLMIGSGALSWLKALRFEKMQGPRAGTGQLPPG